MRRILAMGLLALGLLVATGCEPAMKITMATDTTPICSSTSQITGKVTPDGATTKLVLQRTVKGKWVDWSWLQGTGSSEGRHLITVTPDPSGAYSVQWLVHASSQTVHLRMRSSGGGSASPGVYVTPYSDIPESPCAISVPL